MEWPRDPAVRTQAEAVGAMHQLQCARRRRRATTPPVPATTAMTARPISSGTGDPPADGDPPCRADTGADEMFRMVGTVVTGVAEPVDCCPDTGVVVGVPVDVPADLDREAPGAGPPPVVAPGASAFGPPPPVEPLVCGPEVAPGDEPVEPADPDPADPDPDPVPVPDDGTEAEARISPGVAVGSDPAPKTQASMLPGGGS